MKYLPLPRSEMYVGQAFDRLDRIPLPSNGEHCKAYNQGVIILYVPHIISGLRPRARDHRLTLTRSLIQKLSPITFTIYPDSHDVICHNFQLHPSSSNSSRNSRNAALTLSKALVSQVRTLVPGRNETRIPSRPKPKLSSYREFMQTSRSHFTS